MGSVNEIPEDAQVLMLHVVGRATDRLREVDRRMGAMPRLYPGSPLGSRMSFPVAGLTDAVRGDLSDEILKILSLVKSIAIRARLEIPGVNEAVEQIHCIGCKKPTREVGISTRVTLRDAQGHRIKGDIDRPICGKCVDEVNAGTRKLAITVDTELSPGARMALIGADESPKVEVATDLRDYVDYVGLREPGPTGARTVLVQQRKGSLESTMPLPPRNDLFDHSPDGFNWGYHGSGPAQLALAILVHHLWNDGAGGDASVGRALRLHQAFKELVIAPLKQDRGFTLTADEVQAAVNVIELAVALPKGATTT